MKRFLDLSVSICVLVLFSPIYVLITVSIYLNMGHPVFFKQRRPGKDGKVFNMYKFRTMTEKRDSNGKLLPDEYRLTKLGAFIRGMSLDELPTFINILKGDMGLVGPRPLLEEYLPYYDEYQMRRHEVKPGITGWAQVNGRNTLSWEEKFEYDVWYVDNQSIWLDLKILFLTLFKVLRKEGISAKGHVTMPKFSEIKEQEREH